MSYTPKTDDELKALAKDLYAGQIFASVHLARRDDLPMVFMTLFFMGKEAIDEMEADDITFVYEYLSRQTGRCINGQPTFFSHRALNRADALRLKDYYEKVNEAMAAL